MNNENQRPLYSDKKTIFVLMLILLVAVFLRLIGINFGLPLRFHPDEWSQILPALSMFDGNLHPRFFYYPSFTIYCYFILFKIASFIAPTIFKITASNSTFWLLGRIVSVFFGTGVVFLSYLLASKLDGKKAGLFAAFFVAIFPLEVRHSHFAIVDVPLSFWILLAIYFLSNWEGKNDKFHFLILSSFFAGVASSTKYTALPLIAVILILSFYYCSSRIKIDDKSRRLSSTAIMLFFVSLIFFAFTVNPIESFIINLFKEVFSADGIIQKGDLAYFFLQKLDNVFRVLAFIFLALSVAVYFIPNFERFFLINIFDKRIIIPALIAVIVFFAISPYILIDYKGFLNDFKFSVKVTSLGFYGDKIWSNLDESFPLFTYWKIFVNNSGILLSILCFAGLFFSIEKKFLPLFLWIGIYVFILSSMKLSMPRFLLPVSSIFLIFAGIALSRIGELILRKISLNYLKILITSLALLIIALTPFNKTINIERAFLSKNTLNIAFRWIERNIPEGKKLLLAGISPDMRLSEKRYFVSKIEKTDNIYDVRNEFSLDEADYFISGYATGRNEKILYGRKKKLLKAFIPSKDITGPKISIYKIVH
ncbi:MAG: phospholipid carrier-dependent glycosyltransferase [Candidatus Schekmanbacteria bacterium]|nr:MAG: phospholipid carrier-dependent glycosyltransferase [Candidatus Schekmanbacteria bacterium]